MSNQESDETVGLPDGAYSVWNGRIYRTSVTSSGNPAIRPLNPDDVDESFETDQFGGRYRQVERAELTSKFRLTTYCIYRGHRFQVLGTNDDGTLSLRLARMNLQVARELRLTEYDREYYIDAHPDEIDNLAQEKMETR